MIKTCRISIPYPGYDDWREMKPILESHLAQAGLTIEDVSLKGENYSDTSHFGNWVYVPALDIPELHNTDLELDLPGFILERSDIETLKEGDKVRIQYRNALAWNTNMEGKVSSVYEKNGKMTVDILKKGTKSGKGWRIREGEEVGIFPL